MNKLILEHTEDTPKVELNKEDNIFSIVGRSLPENAMAYYEPILAWLKEYGQQPNAQSYFDIQLDYFNTASAKQITKVLLVIQTLSESSDITVRWHYLKDDLDIYTSGLRFQKLIKAKIELIEIED